MMLFSILAIFLPYFFGMCSVCPWSWKYYASMQSYFRFKFLKNS